MAKKKTAPKTTPFVEPEQSILKTAHDVLKSLGKDTPKKDFLTAFHEKHPSVKTSDSTLGNYYNSGRKEFGWTRKRKGGRKVAKRAEGLILAVAKHAPSPNGKPSLSDIAAAIQTLTAAGLIN